MKISTITKIFTLFFISLFFISCQTEYKKTTIKEELVKQLDDLKIEIEQFKVVVEQDQPLEKIQNAFSKTRTAYKKVEWAVEYFTPDPARFINGPALDELEVEENKFLPPNGFQVIEEFIFPEYDPQNKSTLSREIAVLKGNIAQVTNHLNAITLSPDLVLDATKLEVYRILTLGITGFDSPVALQSIKETPHSLNGLLPTIEKLNVNNSKEEKELKKLISEAVRFCEKNTDFNQFDRANFIKLYLNPISERLVVFQKDNNIAMVNRNSVVNQNSGTLFSTESFNVDAFIPSNEYLYSDAKAALGKELFYETKLSKSNDRSCASCHHPDKAFTDGLKTNSSLLGLKLPRNTPTLTYASLQNAQFWDMRQADLEKQSLAVIQNRDEMHGDLKNSIPLLEKEPKYKSLFQKAFKTTSNIEEWKIQNAIASYIRSLNKFNSKYDRYFQSKGSFTEEEKLGFNLFAGKAKCATCHFIPLFNGTVPPVYRKTEQEVIGTPQTNKGLAISEDLGRYYQYKMPQLKNAFKTPTLRNVALTAPYMHNGVYDSLEQVIDFYNKGGGVGIGLQIENQTLPPDNLTLTKTEEKALIAFLKTLTDE